LQKLARRRWMVQLVANQLQELFMIQHLLDSKFEVKKRP
jgi:hypothetical protein